VTNPEPWTAHTPATPELVLEFERRCPGNPPGKESLIREHFNLSAARYYQIRNQIINTEHALQLDPVTVNRIREQLHQATTARRERRFT
jgi:Protein of unknown function (DUF3263)